LSYRNIRNAVRTAEARNWSHHVDFSFPSPGSIPAFPLLTPSPSLATDDVASTLLSLRERARDDVVFSLFDIWESVCEARRWYEAGVKSVMLRLSLSIGASLVYGSRSVWGRADMKKNPVRVRRLCYPATTRRNPSNTPRDPLHLVTRSRSIGSRQV
jgi:hypothetical protein